jgi:hypothetical protein
LLPLHCAPVDFVNFHGRILSLFGGAEQSSGPEEQE